MNSSSTNEQRSEGLRVASVGKRGPRVALRTAPSSLPVPLATAAINRRKVPGLSMTDQDAGD